MATMNHYETDLIEVRVSAGKGLGVFAKVNIPRGTRVLSELPLLDLGHDNSKNLRSHDILNAFELLPRERQSFYLSLHRCSTDSFKRVVEHEMKKDWIDIPEVQRTIFSIYAANAFGTVFLRGSRFNHSCLPNTHFSFNRSIEQETLDCVRDITAGEELTIMYPDVTNRSRSQRQKELDKWGFTCTCPACEDTPEGKKKELKRIELQKLDRELGVQVLIGTDMSFRQALRIAQEMAAQQESEGLAIRALAISYYNAAKFCLELKDTKMALLWAEKQLEVDLWCVGDDHPDTQRELKVVNWLRNAAIDSEYDECVAKWYHLADMSKEPCEVINTR